MAKYDPVAGHRASSFGQNIGSSAALPNSSLVAPPISNFASASLVKSLNYVRSLVARHIPKLSFQPIPQSLASASTKQSLPSLSSFLNRSLQLNPEAVTNREHLESKELQTAPDLTSSASEKVDGGEHGYDTKYISFDILNWRWHVYGERQTSRSAKERYFSCAYFLLSVCFGRPDCHVSTRRNVFSTCFLSHWSIPVILAVMNGI